MPNRSQLTHRIAFSLLKGVTRVHAQQILARVGSEEEFFKATAQQLAALMGTASQICRKEYRDELLRQAAAEVNFVESNSVRCLYFTDDEYPHRLDACDDAPLMLYALGRQDFNAGRFVGVVGTRHATPYGTSFTEGLVADMAKRVEGLTVVSGLAFGIDVAAHKASLQHGVPTVGVLAHGFSTLYPAAHRTIAARMVKEGGALLTEYVHDAPIHRANFLARNRIVAGISDCLVVAESAAKGGAMVTANIASCYGRDVFALPGRSSDTYSAGCNRLISHNIASLATSASDVVEALGWPTRPEEGEQQSLPLALSAEEAAVVAALTELGEAQVNQLSVRLGCSINRLMALLVDMEFKGLLLNYPGGRYRLAVKS